MYPFIETENAFTASGLKIFYRHCPAENERARLVIAHGLGEHSGRYGNVIEALVPHGISIWALDHRGHGQSGGLRGHISSFQEYVDDLKQMIQIVRENMPSSIKVFLLGHSMGGLIGVLEAVQHQDSIHGLILSSPGLGAKVKVPTTKQVLGKVMSSIWPSLSVNNELDSSKVSRDQKVVLTYDQDPLIHDRVTPRWYTEYLAAMERANQVAQDLKVPLLMQVAGDDHLVDAHASRLFFEKVSSKDKTLRVYDGLYHEIYNELKPAKAQVLGDLKKWVLARI